MNLSPLSLQMAGGVVLFLIALRMVFPPPPLPADAPVSEPLIVPLAVPALAGPSALATVMLLVSQAPERRWEWVAALCVTMAVCAVVLLLAERLQRVVGLRVLLAFERLMGLILVALSVEMLLRVPVGMAMGLVGVVGYSYLVGPGPALKLVGQTSMRTVTDYTFGVIPMFMLMGALVSVSGVSRELFKAANSMIGHLRGGLGVATVVACGGFAAICGSSVATAATFSAVAYPEMRRFNYPQSFSTGVIAAGGTLGAILPPSTVLAVYAILTQQDIGKLFMAGIVPGILAMAMYVLTIAVIVKTRPGWLPGGEVKPWSERLKDLKNVWAPLVLFVFVIGGLYGGFFTPTEAGGVGASGAFILGLVRRKLDGPKIREALLSATRTAAAVFTVARGRSPTPTS